MYNWNTTIHGERYLEEVNRNVFATLKSEEVFARRFGSSLFEDNCFYLILGTDSGLLPEYVAKNLSAESKSQYVFVELEDILATVRDRGIRSHPQIQVCSPDELPQCRTRARFSKYCFLDRLRQSASIALEMDLDGRYAKLKNDVELQQTKYIQSVRQSAHNKIFLKRQILNAPEYLHSATDLLPRFAGKNILILAGGPSLDDRLEWIKKNREAFIVIAVTRIGGLLAVHDLEPDFYAVIDPHPNMLTVSRMAIANSNDTPLIASWHANPTIIDNWRGPVFFDGARLPWQSDLNPPPLITSGPTVTHFAVSVAIAGRPHAIYLAGMDLCFGRDGLKSHCSQSADAMSGPALGRAGVQPVTTYAGETSDADVHLLISADTAAHLAHQARKCGISIFNLSSSAAVVDGIDYIRPEELQLNTHTNTKKADSSRLGIDDESIVRYLKQLATEFESTKAALVELATDLELRRKKIPELFDIRGFIRKDVSVLVSGIDAAVSRRGKDLERLIKHWGGSDFLQTLSTRSEENVTANDLKRFYSSYYDAYLSTIAEIIDSINQASEKIRRRLQELHSQDLASLAKSWEENTEPLRIEKHFLKRRLERLAPYESTRLRMHNAFDKLNRSLEYADKARCENKITQRNAVTKAFYLYTRKRTSGLDDLASFVETIGSPKFSSGLRFLIRGLALEVDERFDEALAQYELVIQSGDSELLEPALRQILVVAQTRSDYLLSLQVLECLEGLSKSYLKYHAEILLSLGDTRQALDKLADYHEVFPHDVDNLLRIVEVYHASGHTSHARELLHELQATQRDHQGVEQLARRIDPASATVGPAVHPTFSKKS